MRRILLIMAMLLVCAMCFAKTYGLTLHLHSYYVELIVRKDISSPC